ncbi:MAG TPA: VWA domain-containing protein [Rectinemataceae bacterium]
MIRSRLSPFTMSNRRPGIFVLGILAASVLLILGACATRAPVQNLAPPSPAGLPEMRAMAMAPLPYPSPQAGMGALTASASGGADAYAQIGQRPAWNTEEYDRIVDNPFLDSLGNPLSTFSIDVDTASYSNLRRFLFEERSLPPKDAVRIEELVNYFPYGYAAPKGSEPLAAYLSMMKAPWNTDHHLLRVAVKAAEIPTDKLPPSNLVFLLDTSGSMDDENKLPLLKEGLRILVKNLKASDRVSIVAYAGNAGLVLPATPGDKGQIIMAAVERLQAQGSTAGSQGLQLAYKIAKEQFIKGGNNRVILATDGDFNIGISSTSELERYIEKQREEGIYLTVLGLGMGNYKDARMETLADKGNGNYAYIDNLLEAKKVLGKEIWGTIYAVAKDVKIQIEFNPALVKRYRLIGYENRLLAKEDFNDDTKDAGEMGSGQTVTALYELVLAESLGGPKEAANVPGSPGSPGTPPVDPLAFQTVTVQPSDDLLVFKLRYKLAKHGGEESILMASRLPATSASAEAMNEAAKSDDFNFVSAVAEFGMLLRESPYKAQASWKALMDRARRAKGADPEGYRAEFIKMAEMAQLLMER